MKKTTVVLSIVAGLVLALFSVPRFFADGEFHGWADKLNPALRPALDRFRLLWGAPVYVSGSRDAVGRHGGPDDASQHNVDRWGYVNAADIFPEGLQPTRADILRALAVAESAGFTGVGVYLDTSRNGNPAVMMHVDVRESGGRVATWGRVGGEYISLSRTLDALPA